MERSKLQIALRRNSQKRGWRAYADGVAEVLGLDSSEMQVLEAEESLRFERELFTMTRAGFKDGWIRRIVEINEDKVESVVAEACLALSSGRVIIAPTTLMEFAFIALGVPKPRQLRQLVDLDGDAVFVVHPDMTTGMQLDRYDCEKSGGVCFEVDFWVNPLETRKDDEHGV